MAKLAWHIAVTGKVTGLPQSLHSPLLCVVSGFDIWVTLAMSLPSRTSLTMDARDLKSPLCCRECSHAVRLPLNADHVPGTGRLGVSLSTEATVEGSVVLVGNFLEEMLCLVEAK